MESDEEDGRARYTLEFKLEAVRLAKSGQSIAAAAKIVGLVEQTLLDWVKADQQGKLMAVLKASP